MEIFSAVLLLTVLGAIGGGILVAATKFMEVKEDPRIAEVAEVLAGANCGGCGYAGCADYAKAVVAGTAPCDLCAPAGPACTAAIGKIMGVEASAGAAKKAFVGCQGTSDHCKGLYGYTGIPTCAAASKLYGGPKACDFACLGFGDCAAVCKFDAIHVVDGVAVVDPEKCTGCGACKNACPKHVLFMSTDLEKPVVMCSNHNRGPAAMKMCNTACIACGLCERNCPEGAIKVTDFVARIDYTKCTGCGICMAKCPKKIIKFPLKAAE